MIESKFTHTAEGWRLVAGHPHEVADDLAWFTVEIDVGAKNEEWKDSFDPIGLDISDLEALTAIFTKLLHAARGAA